MLTSFQKKRDKVITSGIFIAALVFGTFYVILYSLIGLMGINNGFPTTKGLIAQLFFILGIFIITTAFLSTFLLNKRSWPQVNAKITYSSVARNRFSVSISWTLKHVVYFTFNNHEYFKSFYSNLCFLLGRKLKSIYKNSQGYLEESYLSMFLNIFLDCHLNPVRLIFSI